MRKANEHISMVETSHLGPESPRTEAEQYSLGRRVSNWKKLVTRWEEAAARSAEPAAAAARGPTTEEEIRRLATEALDPRCTPAAAAAARAEIQRRYAEEQEAEKRAARERAEREAAEPLPEGWTRHRNPDARPNARPYYYHNAGWAKAGAPPTVHTIWAHPGLTPPLPWTPPEDVSDAGHLPEVLPEAMPYAFTQATAFFRAVPKSALGLAENLKVLAVVGRRHLKAVDACRSSWPRDARGTIQGYYIKWSVLHSRWAAAAGVEVELGFPFTGTMPGIDSLYVWRRAQEYYRGQQQFKRTCLMCGKTAPLSSRAFSYCSGCRRTDVARSRWARYCSEACQRAHWLAGHADECPCMDGVG